MSTPPTPAPEIQIHQLRTRIAALEELLDVQEQTVLAQAARLDEELRLRETAQTELRSERNALAAIVGQQQQLIDTIRQLSAPLLPLNDDVLMMPLIGHIDARRSSQILETLLLQRISERLNPSTIALPLSRWERGPGGEVSRAQPIGDLL